MQRRIEMMMTVREQTATARPETGPARAVAPEDWSGVFIRGDDAETFGSVVGRSKDMMTSAELEMLQDLRELLSSAREEPSAREKVNSQNDPRKRWQPVSIMEPAKK